MVSKVPSASKTIDDDKQAKVVSNGIQGYWFPDGGGSKICPGRFFAKNEIFASMAILLHEFDIELLDPEGARKMQPDLSYFPVGAFPHPPRRRCQYVFGDGKRPCVERWTVAKSFFPETLK
jgi:hypothetical protein